jgi:hypothetical protein
MSLNGAGNTGLQTMRSVLERVVTVLESSGYYAYIHLDEENRLGVSADTEDGHADIRFEGGTFIVEAWDTSPGLFWEEENERRFHALERRARIILPAIARGVVDLEQEVWWDEADHGVGARVREVVNPEEFAAIPEVLKRQFEELNRLLAEIERRLLD